MIRLYLLLATGIGISVGMYYWHYKPMEELEFKKAQVLQLENLNEVNVFEAVQANTVKLLKEQDYAVKDIEVNTSIGTHSISFE